MTSSDDLFLPGKRPPRTRLMFEDEKAAAISDGVRRGATLRPPAAPVPLLRSSSVADLVRLISRSAVALEPLPGMRALVNVVGDGGTGTSTLAVRAAALAKGRGQVIYLDLSRVRRPEEVARKILLALKAPLEAAQAPLASLGYFSRSVVQNDDVLLLDNCTDTRILSAVDLDLPKCIIVSGTNLKKSRQPLRSFATRPIDLMESERLIVNLVDSATLPTKYIEDLSSWVSEWPAGIPFVKSMVQHGRIEELAAMSDLRPSASEGTAFLASRIWELISQDASVILSALLTADWLQVNTASIQAMTGVPTPWAQSALEELRSLGVLVKVPRAYRLQNSTRMTLLQSKLGPRQWRRHHRELAIRYTLSRVRRIAREIVDVTAVDETTTMEHLDPAVRRSYSTFVNDIAWLEREWPSVEALLEDAATDLRSADIDKLLNFLRSSLPPLGRLDSLRRLQEREYRASQAYGVQEQRDSLQNLSVSLWNEGRLPDAIAAQNRVVNLSRETAEPRQLGSDLLRLALLKTEHGEADDATSALEEAVAVFRGAQIVDGEAGALLNLGDLYEKAGDSEDALAAYSRAIQLLNDSSHAHDRGLALLRLGAIHESHARWDSARQAYLDAAATLERVRDESLVALSWLRLGSVDAKEGNLDGSISALMRALETYRNLSDRAGELTALLLLGDVAHTTGNSEDAGTYYRQALDIALKVDDSLNVGRSYAGLGKLYSEQGNLQDALGMLNQALTSFGSAGLHEDRATVLELLADVYEKQADYSNAVSALSEALEIYSNIGDSKSSIKILTQLGNIYHHMGIEEKAASYFEQGAARARGIGDYGAEATALQGLRRSYIELHLPAEAMKISPRIDYLDGLIGTTTADDTDR